MTRPIQQVKGNTISHRLSRKMKLQAGVIAAVAILSIGASSVFIERLLARAALENEASHFWDQYKSDPNTKPPQTANVMAYLATEEEKSHVPKRFQELNIGFHKLSDITSHALVYVSERAGERLYVHAAAEYMIRPAFFFGIMPLIIVLLLIVLTAWWIYWQSNKLLSPIVWLANKFERFDPAHPNSSVKDLGEIPGDLDWEVKKLVNALSSYSRRIRRATEREKHFTRGASHEFRTPLTVIKMASDMIMAEEDINDHTRKYASRIRSSARYLEELIDAFLILARETDKEFVDEAVPVAEIARRELKIASIYRKDKCIRVLINENYDLVLQTAPKVLSIILGNIIRNAMIYTQEGSITVNINKTNVQVIDTGKGLTSEQIDKIFQPYYRAGKGKDKADSEKRQGYGIGLTIVQRLSSLFDWTVDVKSEIGKGSTFTLHFFDVPDSDEQA